MKTKKLIFIIFYSFIFSIIIISCGQSEGSDETGENSRQLQKVNVEVETLKNQKFTDFISVVGTVKPIQSAKLSISEGGIVDKYFRDKGDYVAQGDTILELENDVLKANLDAAKARYDLAQNSFERQEEVYKDNVNSEFQFVESKSNRDQAKADYELIKARYDKTYLKAPFAGLIDAKYVEEGEMAVPGSPIVNLINNNIVKIEAGIPEQYTGQVEIGDKVRLEFATIEKDSIFAKVTYVGTSISMSNRTFPIEVTLVNKQKLKPEMVAELYIENGDYSDVVIIPEEVTSRTDEGFIVYVAEEGKARQRNIEILSRFGNKVAVGKGLNSGDKLIVLGQQNLVEGENIEVVN